MHECDPIQLHEICLILMTQGMLFSNFTTDNLWFFTFALEKHLTHFSIGDHKAFQQRNIINQQNYQIAQIKRMTYFLK